MSSTYPLPSRPFPFPKDLQCGAPYIHWPADKDILIWGDLDTEVAIPETWVDVGVGEDGTTNRTKEVYSLVMPRKSTIGCDTTEFVPVYRNKTFETSDDKYIQPDKYYLEYLGAPSAHVRDHTCDLSYHLLSFRYAGTVYHDHLLAKFESNDWLFQLYLGDTEQQYHMPTRESLAESHVLNVCDKHGNNVRHIPGGRLKCDFPNYVEPEPIPCSSPTPSEAPSGDKGVNLGLAIGLPVGIVGGLLLVGLGVYFAPWFRRRLRNEGAIQL